MKARLAALERHTLDDERGDGDAVIHFLEIIPAEHGGELRPGLYWRGVPGCRAGTLIGDATPPPGIVSPTAFRLRLDGPLPPWRIAELRAGVYWPASN